MAVASADFSEILASVYDAVQPGLADLLPNQNLILHTMRERRGSFVGTKKRYNIRAAYLNATSFTDKKGTFSLDESGETIGAAWYTVEKPLITPLTLNYVDLQTVAAGGKQKIIDYAKEKVVDQTKDHARALNTHLYLPASSLVAGQCLSLDALISDATYDATFVSTTGDVGDIDSSKKSFWQSYRRSVNSNDGPWVLSVDGGYQKLLRTVDREIGSRMEADGTITHIFAGADVYDGIVESLDDAKRYQVGSETVGEIEFEYITYKGRRIYRDWALPANRILFLNTNHLFLDTLNGVWMKREQPRKGYALNTGGTKVEGNLNETFPIVTIPMLATNNRKAHALVDVYDTSGDVPSP